MQKELDLICGSNKFKTQKQFAFSVLDCFLSFINFSVLQDLSSENYGSTMRIMK